jgi:DNA polymerase-1
MRDVALEEIKEYAAEDADVTFQLKAFALKRKHKPTNYLKKFSSVCPRSLGAYMEKEVE